MSGAKWVRVRRGLLCPVCGHPDYCTISVDGTTVHCQRVQSDRKCPGESGGWLHAHPEGTPPPVPEKRPVPRIKDVGALARQMFEHKQAARARWELAMEWGVDRRVLESLLVGVGWDPHNGHRYLSFPSRDGDGRIVGITRRYPDGQKRTLAGTSNGGVFCAAGWWNSPGPVFVAEGASDVAVLLNAGLAAIGRPSNVGGSGVLASFLSRRAVGRRVIVLGENDRKADRVGDVAHGCRLECPGCIWCWPGKYGAESVAKRLAKWKPSIVFPPDGIKDVRAWSSVAQAFSVDLILLANGDKKLYPVSK